MTGTIRRFRPDDAGGLLAVERAIWAESRLSPPEVAELAARPEHGVWVAEVDGRPAGFAWCFLARTGAGATWHLDLLGVHPRDRRRGLGQALIEAALAGGRGRGARECRAIVAAANTASRQAFGRAGFGMDPAPGDLLVRRVPGVARPAVLPAPGTANRAYVSFMFRPGEPPARLTEPPAAVGAGDGAWLEGLPVYTLLYSGLWLDGPAGAAGEVAQAPRAQAPHAQAPHAQALLVQARTVETRLAQALLAEAEAFAQAEGLADLTCLLGPEREGARGPLAAAGFAVENTYHVFRRILA
jgi:ribosomal protein S18 acetylase RimI-like enzyme